MRSIYQLYYLSYLTMNSINRSFIQLVFNSTKEYLAHFEANQEIRLSFNFIIDSNSISKFCSRFISIPIFSIFLPILVS